MQTTVAAAGIEEASDTVTIDEISNDEDKAVVALHPRADRNQHLRIVEAVLFAAAEPVAIEKIQSFPAVEGDPSTSSGARQRMLVTAKAWQAISFL